MATQNPYAEHAHLPARLPIHTTVETEDGLTGRWHQRNAKRKRTRLVSARNRRALAKWVRRTANHAHDPDPIRRRREALLHHGAAAVRTELLEIAAIIEHAHDPDPAAVAALHALLANGCDSPLYNANIHVSELRATLDYVRDELLTHA